MLIFRQGSFPGKCRLIAAEIPALNFPAVRDPGGLHPLL
jgi:hypothetical protein